MTLSIDCEGCNQRRLCKTRFISVRKGEFVYCPNGDRHLVEINQECLTH